MKFTKILILILIIVLLSACVLPTETPQVTRATVDAEIVVVTHKAIDMIPDGRVRVILESK